MTILETYRQRHPGSARRPATRIPPLSRPMARARKTGPAGRGAGAWAEPRLGAASASAAARSRRTGLAGRAVTLAVITVVEGA